MRFRKTTQCRLATFAARAFTILAFALLPALHAGDDGAATRKMLDEGSSDVPAMAAALKDTFVGEQEWDREVARFWSRFQDWEKDTGEDVGRYLNDRLVSVGLSAASGKTEKIRKGILWLAMYQEFDQEAPRGVTRFVRENRESLIRLFADFSWEKASAYVKAKQWRKDAEERKRLAAAKP